MKSERRLAEIIRAQTNGLCRWGTRMVKFARCDDDLPGGKVADRFDRGRIVAICK